MSDYAEHNARALNLLRQSYNHAQSRKLAEAIRLAWEAQTQCKLYAEALEAHRVEMDAKGRQS